MDVLEALDVRGTYRGEERVAIAKLWREQVVPEFKKQEVAPLTRFLQGKKDLIVVDVGANKGFFAKSIIDMFDVKHVYMLDASEENYRELVRSDDNMIFDASDLRKTTALHYACGSNKGTVVLYTNEDGSPLGSLYPHRVAGESPYVALDKKLKVPMQTLDWLVSNKMKGVDSIDLLKIDTEGHELEVLRGASSLLGRNCIDLIHFEFGIHQIEPRHFFADFYSLLKGFGFRLYDVNDGNVYEVPYYQYRYENFGILVTFIAERLR